MKVENPLSQIPRDSEIVINLTWRKFTFHLYSFLMPGELITYRSMGENTVGPTEQAMPQLAQAPTTARVCVSNGHVVAYIS